MPIDHLPAFLSISCFALLSASSTSPIRRKARYLLIRYYRSKAREREQLWYAHRLQSRCDHERDNWRARLRRQLHCSRLLWALSPPSFTVRNHQRRDQRLVLRVAANQAGAFTIPSANLPWPGLP